MRQRQGGGGVIVRRKRIDSERDSAESANKDKSEVTGALSLQVSMQVRERVKQR